jgi:hypothetical protein
MDRVIYNSGGNVGLRRLETVTCNVVFSDRTVLGGSGGVSWVGCCESEGVSGDGAAWSVGVVCSCSCSGLSMMKERKEMLAGSGDDKRQEV